MDVSVSLVEMLGLLTEIVFNHKILTSARNGELIMWDLNKSGSSKYGECKAK